ncbi:hypothetical protein GCM10010417_18460 [Streptomyces carpaticus]
MGAASVVRARWLVAVMPTSKTERLCPVPYTDTPVRMVDSRPAGPAPRAGAAAPAVTCADTGRSGVRAGCVTSGEAGAGVANATVRAAGGERAGGGSGRAGGAQ